MRRILAKDVHLHAYKIQLTQELKPTDHVQREKKILAVSSHAMAIRIGRRYRVI
jgi:hypothetical protein